MNSPRRRSKRRDPMLLYSIQADSAEGLAPAQIAEKYSLPLHAVTQMLRSYGDTMEPRDPFHLTRRPGVQRDATLMYWLGYIAACGCVYDGPIPTLVLDVDARDVLHVQALLADLCQGWPGVEYCHSSQRGLQAYVRDRDLGRLLVRWGIPSVDRQEGSVPISLIPTALLSHFVRGYLEGGRRGAPFGTRRTPVSYLRVKRFSLEGPHHFLKTLERAIRAQSPARSILTPGRNGISRLIYSGVQAQRALQFAYRDAGRSLPRAAGVHHSLQARDRWRSRFGQGTGGRRGRPRM